MRLQSSNYIRNGRLLQAQQKLWIEWHKAGNQIGGLTMCGYDLLSDLFMQVGIDNPAKFSQHD